MLIVALALALGAMTSSAAPTNLAVPNPPNVARGVGNNPHIAPGVSAATPPGATTNLPHGASTQLPHGVSNKPF